MAGETQPAGLELAQQLTDGFIALSGEYQLLFEQQRQLEAKLSWAKQQYLDLLKRFTPDSLSQDHIAFLHDLERVGTDQPGPLPPWVELLSQSDDAERRNRASLIRNAQLAADSLRAPDDSGVKIWSGPAADKEQTTGEMPQLEKDFTTPGTPSKLGCPFAVGSRRHSPLATPRSSMSRASHRGRRSKRPSFTDPIRAEICGNDAGVPSESIEGSAAVCPIRFLNQHDPEEVAKYFEKHKNDLPRSHEVCIKRFQSNAESVQQLDRKYGDLVSMIQGLGQKHQEFLPPEPEEDEDGEDPELIGTGAKKDDRVHNWAEEVSASLDHLTPEKDQSGEDGTTEDRTAHFDRPMKEIRVGESPSRPWGISIPVKYMENAGSSSSVGSAPTASPPLPLDTIAPVEENQPKASKCPFDHRAMGKMAAAQTPFDGVSSQPPPPPPHASEPPPQPPPAHQPQPGPEPQARSSSQHAPQPEAGKPENGVPKVIPQMVFNGPVFFNYPPEQLMALLQDSAFGGMPR